MESNQTCILYIYQNILHFVALKTTLKLPNQNSKTLKLSKVHIQLLFDNQNGGHVFTPGKVTNKTPKMEVT